MISRTFAVRVAELFRRFLGPCLDSGELASDLRRDELQILKVFLAQRLAIESQRIGLHEKN